LIGFPHVTVLPGLVENVYGDESTQVSQLFTASAIGALIASLSVARFADSQGAVLIYSGLAAAFGLGLAGLAWAPNLTWGTLAIFVVGAGSGGFQALNAAVIARETAPEYMGRVMSFTMLAFAGFGLMALPLGAIADRVGEPRALLLMGASVVTLAVLLGITLWRQRAARYRSPDHPEERDPARRSG
jgi:ENTS family enterobactin (siderophore) exporter